MASQQDEQETYYSDEAADTITGFITTVLPSRYEPPGYVMTSDAHTFLNTPARVQCDDDYVMTSDANVSLNTPARVQDDNSDAHTATQTAPIYWELRPVDIQDEPDRVMPMDTASDQQHHHSIDDDNNSVPHSTTAEHVLPSTSAEAYLPNGFRATELDAELEDDWSATEEDYAEVSDVIANMCHNPDGPYYNSPPYIGSAQHARDMFHYYPERSIEQRAADVAKSKAIATAAEDPTKPPFRPTSPQGTPLESETLHRDIIHTWATPLLRPETDTLSATEREANLTPMQKLKAHVQQLSDHLTANVRVLENQNAIKDEMIDILQRASDDANTVHRQHATELARLQYIRDDLCTANSLHTLQLRLGDQALSFVNAQLVATRGLLNQTTFRLKGAQRQLCASRTTNNVLCHALANSKKKQ